MSHAMGVMCQECREILEPDDCPECGVRAGHGHSFQEPNEYAARTWPEHPCFRPIPKRIQLRRTKDWRKPEGAIVVSRPTRLGNHYEARPCVDPNLWAVYNRRTGDGPKIRFTSRLEAVAEAVRRYRTWLLTSPAAPDLTDLRGQDLACWCPMDSPCHADVLLELANGGA